MCSKQGYALKSLMKGFSDEAHYPWGRGLESPKKNRLKAVNPRIITKQLKILIHR